VTGAGAGAETVAGGEALLARVEAAVDGAESGGASTRLRQVQRRFCLTTLEVELLLAALAPDLDARFERLYAYLHDDLTRRRATIGLALELAGASPMDAAARALLGAGGHLVGFGLLEVEEVDRPLLSRTLRVPDRVTAHLLGDSAPDPAIEPYLVPAVPLVVEDTDRIVGALQSGTRFFYSHESPGGSGGSMFAGALQVMGLRVLEIDLTVVAGASALSHLVPVLLREVGLTGSGLVLDRADQLARRDPVAFRRFAEAPAVVCFTGSRSWDPDWARVVPFVVDAPPPSLARRSQLWDESIGDEVTVDRPEGLTTLSCLRMRPLQMLRVVESAQRRAASERRIIAVSDLEAAARLMNSVSLDRLSTRITPQATWNDLCLPPTVCRSVRSVASRARHRELVQVTWGLGCGSRRRGTIALFSGPPGTGKTLAAEVIAGELGVDLYVVNLATVVDKYIGETEKNLEGIFQAAEEVNGLLFFDEADALFGRRSEVKDARDRYANVEVAYLLQRLERFDGVAVLATNLSSNLDEAFARRLDVTAEFRLPEVDERRAIWRISLPAALPLSDDVDLDFLARAFALSGGSIRNICVGAAYLAADERGTVAMRHLIRAAALEHRKLGRLIVESEFGGHYGPAIREVAS
jgi:ATPase family protein associated with various cellular activities (AAA)/winged helix domain-containing protein